MLSVLQSSEVFRPTALAAVAGLSMHHFARQFKQSAGATPHQYLTKSGLNERTKVAVGVVELPVDRGIALSLDSQPGPVRECWS